MQGPEKKQVALHTPAAMIRGEVIFIYLQNHAPSKVEKYVP